MTWQEALEREVARSGHHPYRFLCSEANDRPAPNDWAAYRRLMLRKAGEPALTEERMTAAESLRCNKLMLACPYRSPGSTGCGCGKCALRGGADVTHLDCFACVGKYSG